MWVTSMRLGGAPGGRAGHVGGSSGRVYLQSSARRVSGQIQRTQAFGAGTRRDRDGGRTPAGVDTLPAALLRDGRRFFLVRRMTVLAIRRACHTLRLPCSGDDFHAVEPKKRPPRRWRAPLGRLERFERAGAVRAGWSEPSGATCTWATGPGR